MLEIATDIHLKKYVQICKEKRTKPNLAVCTFSRKIVKSQSQMTLSKNIRAQAATSDNFSHKFANLVIYKCDKCDKTLYCWPIFCQHLKKCQNKIKCQFHKKYIFQKVMHKCKICKKKVLCDKQFIMNHVTSVHKIDRRLSYSSLGEEDKFLKFTFKTVDCDDSSSLGVTMVG